MGKQTEFQYDELQMFFGDDYKVSDYITIHQPTVGEIMEFGERRYYSMLTQLCAIPSDMKSTLWDVLEVDWNKMSDFELFAFNCHSLRPQDTSIILGDLDLSTYTHSVKDKENDEFALLQCSQVDKNSPPEITGIITESDYYNMVGYLRKLHGFTIKREKARNRITRDVMIEEDRQKIELSKNKSYVSQLKNLISAMLTYPGFKYKKSELRECGIYEFMDAVQRSQIYVSTDALLHGMYSGMIDTKKINKKQFNWMRDVS